MGSTQHHRRSRAARARKTYPLHVFVDRKRLGRSQKIIGDPPQRRRDHAAHSDAVHQDDPQEEADKAGKAEAENDGGQDGRHCAGTARNRERAPGGNEALGAARIAGAARVGGRRGSTRGGGAPRAAAQPRA